MSPTVTVSLDFELRWGLLDILGTDASRYRRNLEGVREVVPRLLEAFRALGVRATWATVGAIACDGWDEWQSRAPSAPRYDDPALRWRDEYRRLDLGGRLHFAPDLVAEIARTPGQELASHTFSHVYFREPGFTRQDAVADAEAMVRLFEDRWQFVPKSVVFPRNQVAHTDVLRDHGVRSWRENPEPFYWRSTSAAEHSRTARLLRLADAILPLGRRAGPVDAHRASYFVRLGLPERLWRLHQARIRNDARRMGPNDTLHLWWHPHNLGDDPARKTARVAELVKVVRDAAPDARFASMNDLAS